MDKACGGMSVFEILGVFEILFLFLIKRYFEGMKEGGKLMLLLLDTVFALRIAVGEWVESWGRAGLSTTAMISHIPAFDAP